MKKNSLRNGLVFTISLMVFTLANSCSKGDNLIDKAKINYELDESGEMLKAINIEFNTSKVIIDKYLYVKSNKSGYVIVFNNTNDTLYFDDKNIKKQPFSEVHVVPYKDTKYRLLHYDKARIKQMKIILTGEVKFKTYKLDEISILSEDMLNAKFSKYKLYTSNGLPVIKIETEGSIPFSNVNGQITIYENIGKGMALDSSYITYSGKIKTKVRGNTSKLLPKKGLKIKLTDKKKKNQILLGMPKEHDWVLYGPYTDVSLIRNKFAYDLSVDIGRYAPRTQYCELIVNNEYLGIYLLTEKIKADKNRVDIKFKDKTASDSLKTFMLKIDSGDDVLFQSDYLSEVDSGWFQFFHPVYPKQSKLEKGNTKVMFNRIDAFETALLKKDESYLNYIDVNSFVDYFILNELTKNTDAYRLSTFIYQDTTGRIKMGPLWDFNYSLGLTETNNAYLPEGWIYKSDAVPFWWDVLVTKPTFVNRLKQRWHELRLNQMATDSLLQRVDHLTELTETARDDNFTRWDVFDSKHGVRHTKAVSYKGEIKEIKDWLQKRVKWMDLTIATLN